MLVGCASKGSKPITVEKDARDEVFVCKIELEGLPYPSAVYWQPVSFYVLNKEIMGRIVDGDTTYPSNLIAMDSESYEHLSENMRQILSHIKESKSRIQKTDEYYKHPSKKVD